MLKKTLTYKNYFDVEVTRNFLFDLNKAELTEMQSSTGAGFDLLIQQIVDAKETPSIVKIFKEIILKAYGELDDSGEVFMKSEEISRKFACTKAYEIIFMELVQDPDKTAEFIKGIMPKDIEVPEVVK